MVGKNKIFYRIDNCLDTDMFINIFFDRMNIERQVQIPKVVAMASIGNLASIQVMKKIGMKYWKEFDHPELQEHPEIQRCSLYQIKL
jgi:RimJ/RimL family protein N-acetyltransferase